MSGYRDLLLHLDDAGSNASRIRAAIDLAVRFGAHLTGFYALRPAAQARHYIPAELIARHHKAVLEQAAEQRQAFETACQAAGLACEWLQSEMPPISGMKLAGRVCDLAILQKPSPVAAGRPDAWYGEPMLPHELSLRMGRPVLILPAATGLKAGELGKRVLVAWNGSREATRAVHDALPFLTDAAHILLLSVDPEATGGTPAEVMARHLARHGAKVEVHNHVSALVSGEEPVEAILREAMQHYGMDLLVMGAYGHARLREMVFGGVTEAILDGFEKPVMFSN